MKLIKDIFKVISSNFVMLLSNLIIGFALPIFLSVKEYGLYRQYMLYVGYVAIFNLGYIDGIYIKYGGKNNDEVDKNTLFQEHKKLLFFQSIVSMLMIIISLLFKNIIMLFLSLSIIPINISGFHKLYYQATGQFNKYSLNTILFTIFNLIFVTTAIFIFKITQFQYYAILSIMCYGMTLVIMEIDFYRNTKTSHVIKISLRIIDYIKVGIFILFGNISLQIFNTIGLWFTNIFLSIHDFATYSFANSVLTMILSIISAAGLTFYNYIAKNDDYKFLIKTKKILFLLGSLSGLAFFVIKFLITHFITKYLYSINIIAISFVSIPYMMIINVLLLNLYKAKRSEKKYLFTVGSMLLVNIMLTLISFTIFKNIISIVTASTLSFIIWYLYSINRDFKFLKGNRKEYIIIVCQISTFLFCSHLTNEIYGMLLYTAFVIFIYSIVKKTNIMGEV